MSFLREPGAEPLPGYRLIEPLGSGGFGEAWKCEAPGGIFKAIKFVFGNLNSLDVDGARAEQELKALHRIKEVRHPFVLQMDRIEIVNGELAIVMELADKSLHDAFEEAQSAGLVGIPRDSLLRYTRDAAEALDHMNEKHGLQHLDIKPRNLFLVCDRVKVADFGLVKHLERSGNSGIMGAVTPLYAPPETFTSDLSPASDQYSLAIVYQELLTGHRPFNGKNARQLAHQHMHEPPDLRALPEPERPIVGRALEKDPAKRFPNCLAFVRALYATRAPSFAGLHDGGGSRPKSVVDTLENFQLEDFPADDRLEPVDPPNAPLSKLTESNEAVSHLGVTVAKPSTGSLRPTVVLGVGGYGRRALMELRCRLLDRFGDLDKVPLIRFLYIDTDGDAIKASQRGAAEVAFRASEVYHLPLQPVSHYRRRQIDQLSDWLPREKLYAVPRSLKTQGSRALGRLAFTDNYQRLMARLKRELQHACHPDAIYQTVAQTGLALRDNIPRMFVVGCATGGASGFVADLGYALRRLLKQSNQPESPVTSFLFCGAPDDPATPRAEQANLYATLTELHHFTDPAIRFSAQYGTDGPRLIDEGTAFDQVYLLSQQHRSPEARRDALAHMGSYLFHEMTTPLGLRLDQGRLKRKASLFRSLGTFGVWFPRGLMLRLAAREACLQLLEEWQSGGNGLTSPEQSILDAAVARVTADPELRPDTLANRIDVLAAEHMDFPPREGLTRLLVTVEEQSLQQLALDDPGVWARQTLSRMRDWLGSGVALPGINAMQQRRSALTRALEAAASTLAQEWAGKLGEVIDGLMEYSGRRLAVAEAAVARLMNFCDEALVSYQTRLNKDSRSQANQEQLDSAVQNCITGSGGWSLFGGKSRRLLRVFVDHLAAFSRQCLADDTSAAVLQFFALLRGKLGDRMRDLGFCRQRLRGLQDLLRMQDCENEDEGESVGDTVTFARTPQAQGYGGATWGGQSAGLGQTPLLSTEAYWQSIRESATNRVVLPDGESDLETAGRRFLATLSPEHWTQLDHAMGDAVLAPRGGLLKLCLEGGDVVRHFAAPLLNQAIGCLSDHLPITDVAQVEFSAEDGLLERILGYHACAIPAVSPREVPTSAPARAGSGVRRAVLVGAGSDHGPEGRNNGRRPPSGTGDHQAFLLVPVSEAGQEFGEEAKRLLPDLQLVNVPGQADLMFCREQAALKVDDLEAMLRPCRNAYYEACLVPQSSPHARFDISDWTPLDP